MLIQWSNSQADMQKVSKSHKENHIKSMQNRRRRDILKNMEGSEKQNLQLKYKMIQYVEKKRTPGNVEGKNMWLKTNWV